MTVSTFYPDADPETTSVDGFIGHTSAQPAGASWASKRDAVDGSTATPSGATMDCRIASADDTGSGWELFERIFTLFDTATGLPDTDTISEVTLEVVCESKANTISGAPQSVTVITTTPASNTNLVIGDYDQVGTVHQSGDLTIASITADSATFNVFTFNATGRDNVSKTGVSKFGIRIVSEADNAEPAHTGQGGVEGRVTLSTAEEILVGDKRPKLVVPHAEAATFVPRVTIF